MTYLPFSDTPSPAHPLSAPSARTIQTSPSEKPLVSAHTHTHTHATTVAFVSFLAPPRAHRHPHLISVLNVERLPRGCHVSHDAFVPLQPDAVAGRLLQRGPFGNVKEAADQELPVGAVLAHLGSQAQITSFRRI